MAKELYVGHLSELTTEEDLRKLFSVMGVVTSVHLITDAETGEFKRCGYVRMLSNVNLNEVVESLDGVYLIDRIITVSIAKPQKDRPVKSAAGSRPWLKGPKTGAAADGRPAAKTVKRPSARPDAKPGSVPDRRQKPGTSEKSASKPGTRTDARPTHGKGARPDSSTPRPRRSR